MHRVRWEFYWIKNSRVPDSWSSGECALRSLDMLIKPWNSALWVFTRFLFYLIIWNIISLWIYVRRPQCLIGLIRRPIHSALCHIEAKSFVNYTMPYWFRPVSVVIFLKKYHNCIWSATRTNSSRVWTQVPESIYNKCLSLSLSLFLSLSTYTKAHTLTQICVGERVCCVWVCV